MESPKEIDTANLEATEKRLQLLYQITSQTRTSLNEQLNKALELTTNLLGMDIGIISTISGSTYTIRNFFPEDSGLAIDQTFELGNTYCSITLKKDDVFAINYMKESEYERHPCYEAFLLESYIGIPITIDDELYGTINFSSPKPKENGFLPSDYTLIKLLAEWAGATIKKEEVREKLNESMERYKLLSSNSADLICLHDLEGNYEFISPSIERILGYTYQELLGKNHYSLIHEDDIEFLREGPHQQLREGELVPNIQYRIRNKNSEYIWFESSVTPVIGDEGYPIQLQSVSRDINDRKRLELLFAQAQEMANVGGWEFELETGKLFWTDEVYRIHDEEVGSEIDVSKGVSYFPGEAKDKIEAAIAMTIETGRQYDLVLPFVSAKGIEKWVRAIGKAHYQDGTAYNLSGTFQDISKQVSSEKRILAQNEEMQTLTATKDKLYSILAHDLKGAFFGIIGMLDIISENLANESLEKLDLVSVSAQNAYELLENMLDWIRVQDAGLDLEKETIDLEKLIKGSVSVFDSAAVSKSIEIINKVKGTQLEADKNMLSTVFRNLISNAIKYSNKGSKIVIDSEVKDDTVEIRVKDSGVGMTDDIKKLLFNKESRPQRRGTMYEKGTGLGLLLCEDLVGAHNGKINVVSEDGKGSEFIVTLPKY